MAYRLANARAELCVSSAVYRRNLYCAGRFMLHACVVAALVCPPQFPHARMQTVILAVGGLCGLGQEFFFHLLGV